MTNETRTTHTPGPWMAIPGDAETREMSSIHVAEDSDHPDNPMLIGYALFDWQNEKQQQEDLANARLIAAAPNLLEACRSAAKHWEDTDAPIGKVLRDAIATAEGTSTKSNSLSQ